MPQIVQESAEPGALMQVGYAPLEDVAAETSVKSRQGAYAVGAEKHR